MPKQENYNLDYRPASYWNLAESNAHIGARVKGELRRAAAMDLAENEILDHVISVESLPLDQAQAAGAVHPWFMGGEYLPDLYQREVEIARVTLKSTTLDVISIRARRTRHRIKYCIVDEYYDDPVFHYPLIQKTSVQPLTMRQLIRIIDNAQERGLDGEARFHNYSCGTLEPEDIYDFAVISSQFYPELQGWYDEANEEWLAEEKGKLLRAEAGKGWF